MSTPIETARLRDAILQAASEITDLWWARPDQNGQVKTAVVAQIIWKHLEEHGNAIQHG